MQPMVVVVKSGASFTAVSGNFRSGIFSFPDRLIALEVADLSRVTFPNKHTAGRVDSPFSGC
jgi:hypothetical protein